MRLGLNRRPDQSLVGGIAGTEQAPYLAGPGITVEVLAWPAHDGDLAEPLCNHARLTRSGIILVGAHVHAC